MYKEVEEEIIVNTKWQQQGDTVTKVKTQN